MTFLVSELQHYFETYNKEEILASNSVQQLKRYCYTLFGYQFQQANLDKQDLYQILEENLTL